MSIKNLLISTAVLAASLVASCALAGGSDEFAPPPSPPPAFQPYLYVEGNIGYADSDWNHIRQTQPVFLNFFNARSNNSNNLTAGADLGYMVSEYLGAEIGWYYLPRVSAISNGFPPFGPLNSSFSIHSWFAYLAPKLQVPIWDNFGVFGKAGVALRWLDYDGAGRPTGDNQYWRPFFAVGFEYFWRRVMIDAQYSRVPGYTYNRLNNSTISRRAPAANSYTLSLGYRFPFGSM